MLLYDDRMSASVPSLPVVAGSGYSKVSRAVTDPLLCGLGTLETSPPRDSGYTTNNNNQVRMSPSFSSLLVTI